MDVIIQPNQSIIKELPYQRRVKSKKYRLNKMLVFYDLEDGNKLIFNEITNSLIKITPLELETAFTDTVIDYSDFLYRNYFIVTENFNEIDFVEQYRLKNRTIVVDNYLDCNNFYTILTTTKCNARCFYCYELLSKHKHHMSNETAEKVAKYIVDNSNTHKIIQLSWFGGEPLFNQDAIDIITNKIRNEGINYLSSMISNGILFNEDLVKKAVNSWKLKDIQITLDGTEEVYNKTKNYIYKDINPFQVVINNIKTLLKYGIKVSIRLNCDNNNIDDLLNLVDFLREEFKEYNGLGVYAHSIFEIGEFKRTEEQNEELYSKMSTLLDKLVDYNFRIPQLNCNIKSMHCMCDTGSGVMVSVDGEIGICEHFIDSGFFTDINHLDTWDFDTINSWKQYKPAEEMCKDCPLYPKCLKLHNCPDEADCSIGELKYNIHNEQLAMILAYKNYLNNKKNRCNNNCQCLKRQVMEKAIKPKPLTLLDKIKHFFNK